MSKARELAQKPNQPTGRKNLIINGAMNVAQRGTSTTGVTSSSFSACDRARVGLGSLGTWTISQETDAPDGFSNSHKVLCTTADASPAASDLIIGYEIRLEGQDLQHLKYGTSNAQPITLSFWVKSNKTGNASFQCMQTDNSNRNASFQYTINSANTWEYKTIVIPADVSGSFDDDNGLGLYGAFWLNSGSTYTGGSHQTTWAALDQATRNASNLGVGGAVNDYWQITGVQLEVGSVATEFEHLSYGEELALCQRYYTKFDFPQTTPFFPSHRQTGNTVRSTVTTPVPMRTTPTINAGGQPFLSYNWDSSSALLVNDGTSLTVIGSSLDANRFTISNPDVTGVGSNVGSVYAYNGDLECDSEL